MRSSALRRGLATALSGLAAAGAIVAITVVGTGPASAATFYEPPSPLPAGEPGDVIRSGTPRSTSTRPNSSRPTPTRTG